jgi:Zn-dependent protease with chaperone function
LEARDLPIRGLVISMWLSAYLALLGIESRIWLSQGAYVWLALAALCFADLTFCARSWLLARIERGVIVESMGARRLERPKPASAAVVQRVHERALARDVNPLPRVLRLPRTFNAVAAYVYGAGTTHTLVLTGAAEALFLLARPKERKLFDVLVDHELGHIAAKDSPWLYLARGIVLTVLFLLPVKVVTLVLVLRSGWAREYQQLFPSKPEDVVAQLVIGTPASVSTVGLAIFLYTSALLLLLAALHMVVVRRREYTADAFALRGLDPRAGAAALRSLLSATPPWAPAHSFSSDGWWHPPIASRVERARKGQPDRGDLFAPVIGLELLVLLSIRLVFGSSFGATATPLSSGVQKLLSAAYAFLFAYLAVSMFSGLPTRALFTRVATAIMIAAALSIGVLCGYWYLAQVPERYSMARGLFELERWEVLALFASFPVWVGVAAVAAWLVSNSPLVAPLRSAALCSVVTAAVASGSLSLLSAPVHDRMIEHRRVWFVRYDFEARMSQPRDVLGEPLQDPLLPWMTRSFHQGALLDGDAPRLPLGFVMLDERPFDSRLMWSGAKASATP